MPYAITVSDLFQHAVFQNSDTFSTNEGLKHEIGTCTIMDIPTISSWLNPHDVLIVGDYTANCLNSVFIDNLHNKNIACLITKKKYRPNFTQEIVQKFYEYNIPIIQVSDNYAWSAIIRAVQQLQFDHYRGVIQEQETFYQSLIQASIKHSSYGSLGSIFNTSTGASLAIIDADKNLVDASFDVNWVPIIKTLNSAELSPQVAINHDNPQTFGNYFAPKADSNLARIWSIPVYFHRQLHYYILIGLQDVSDYLPDNLMIKLGSVKKVIMIKEELQQEINFERFFKINETFQQTMTRHLISQDDLIALQSLSGIQLQDNLSVAKLTTGIPASALFENSSLIIQAALTKYVNQQFPGIVIYHNYSWLIITSATVKALKNDLPKIIVRLSDQYPGLNFRLGISLVHQPTELKRALTEAQGATEYLKINESNHSIQFFDQLGINELFIDDTYRLNHHYIETMLETFINPLVNYDDKHHTELIKTLGCYLHNNFSHTQTSSELFIHKNTLRNRLEKIEQLIGPDHEDLWLNLQISYRLYQRT